MQSWKWKGQQKSPLAIVLDCGQLCYLVFSYLQLKRELANFGPEFFEEIEDLKYNYKEANIRNAQLEEKLKEVCEQFGVNL